MDLRKATVGTIVGTAVGDAIGLPREGLSPGRAMRLFGGPPLRHRFLFGRGMISDDTEHTCMLAQALIVSGGETQAFLRSLSWRMRWWLLGLPGGVGLGTARAIVKMWLGFGKQSGVRSAGNGPAMRVALIGVCFAGDRAKLIDLAIAQAELTHTDPRAVQGAVVIALAASHAARGGEPDRAEVFNDFRRSVTDAELLERLGLVEQYLDVDRSVCEMAEALGLQLGVTGYINNTVPIAVFCWLKWPGDYRRAVEDAIRLGGDTDTTAAIVGALVGASTGEEGIPAEWLSGICEWPRSVAWMRDLGQRLAEQVATTATPPMAATRLFWPAIPARNLLFLCVVLLHGFRRLFPPYLGSKTVGFVAAAILLGSMLAGSFSHHSQPAAQSNGGRTDVGDDDLAIERALDMRRVQDRATTRPRGRLCELLRCRRSRPAFPLRRSHRRS